MRFPYVLIFTPNVDNIKTNNRISPQERMNIEKFINSMPVADYNEEYQEPGKLKNIRKLNFHYCKTNMSNKKLKKNLETNDNGKKTFQNLYGMHHKQF